MKGSVSFDTGTGQSEHYLEAELHRLIRDDGSVFNFLQRGCLDGCLVWDLENPEHEWMSARFWQLLGYDPDTKPHLASAWQDIIDPDDLQTALHNFERHVADPDYL